VSGTLQSVTQHTDEDMTGWVIYSPPLQPVHISQQQLETSYFSSRSIWGPKGKKKKLRSL